MKTLHYSIIAIFVFVVVIIIIVEYPIPHGSSIMITPSKPYIDNTSENSHFTIDEQKARSLAENSVDELKTTYGCHFDSLTGIVDNSSKLQYVRVGYNCNKYVGAFVIMEDPQLNHVINVTTYPISRFGS